VGQGASRRQQGSCGAGRTSRCGPECRTRLATEASAQADVEAARQALLQAQRKATSESLFKAPVWLLSAALDAVAFMAIWTGLSGAGWASPKRVPAPSPSTGKT
jgi:hypothetical protein